MSEIYGPIDYGRFRKILREELRLLSPSFIPEMVVKRLGTDELAPYGLNHIYNARVIYFDDAGRYLYTEFDVDLSKYWVGGEHLGRGGEAFGGGAGVRLRLPPNQNTLAIYARRAISYPYIVGYVKYPDWVSMGLGDLSGLYIGCELGGAGAWGIASWYLAKNNGANRLYASLGGGGYR